MKRRDFLRNAAIAGAMAAATPFLERFSYGADAVSGSTVYEIEEATFAGLQDAMKTGSVTSRWITETYLKRINDLDKHGR